MLEQLFVFATAQFHSRTIEVNHLTRKVLYDLFGKTCKPFSLASIKCTMESWQVSL